MARTRWRVAALALIATWLGPPAGAQSPAWGSRPYEEEKPLYDALVAALETSGHQLLSRVGQVRNDTQAFLGGFREADRAWLEQEYTRHADYRNRNDLFERRYARERQAKALYDDARAVYDALDEKRPEARASLWQKRLDWLRQRNAAREAQLALLDSKLVVMRGIAGWDWEAFWADNAEDVVYVFDKVIRQYVQDLGSCVLDIASAQLGPLLGQSLGPSPWGPGAPPPSLAGALGEAGECVTDSLYKSVVNALAAAWRKQFVDSMQEKDVLSGVAEHWWDEIIAAELPKEPGLASAIKGWVSDQAQKTATGALKAAGKNALARQLANQEVPVLRKRFEALAKNARPSSKADLTAQVMKTAEERGKARVGDIVKTASFAIDYLAKAAELYANSATFTSIETNEVARYRRVVTCLRERQQAVTAEVVVEVLKRDGAGFVAFVRDCRTPDGGACPERVRAAAAALTAALPGPDAVDGPQVRGLESMIVTLEADAASAGAALERELAGVRDACAPGGAAGAPPDALEAELRALAAAQGPLVTRACTPDADDTEAAAAQARETARRMRERIAGAPAASPPTVPAPTELLPVGERAAALAAQAAALSSRLGAAHERRERLLRAVTDADEALAACPRAGGPDVDALRSRTGEARARLAAGLPDAASLRALGDRAAAVSSLIDERVAMQRRQRACLAATGAAAGAAERRARILADAEAAADRAATCAGGPRMVPGPSEPSDGFDVGALVGRPLREAVGIVTGAGLQPRPQVGSPAPSPAREGRVEAATRHGDEVVLVVFTAAVAAGRVPNVTGLGLREAHAAVAGAGFTPVVEMGDDAPTPERANTVAGQRPAAGTEVRPGADVTLTIWTEAGPPGRIVPNLLGVRLDAAQKLAASRELMIDSVVGDAATDYGAQGRVYRQYPDPSVEVPRGVAIRVWVYDKQPPRPRTADTSYDPPPYEPVETDPMPWQEPPADDGGGLVEGLVQRLIDEKQRRSDGDSAGKCQFTGDPVRDAVLRGIWGRDCDHVAGGDRGGGGGQGGRGRGSGSGGGSAIGDICCRNGLEELFGVGCIDGSEPTHPCTDSRPGTGPPPRAAPPSSAGNRCLVDAQVSHGSGGAPFWVQQQDAAAVRAFKIIQTQAPRGLPRGISMHGPYSTVAAARSALDRLCPPSERSTGSIRFR